MKHQHINGAEKKAFNGRIHPAMLAITNTRITTVMALTMRECWLRKARILAGAKLANRERVGGIGAIFI